MSLVSAEVFDSLRRPGLDRTMIFWDWLGHATSLAGQGKGPDDKYMQLRAAYDAADATYQKLLPNDIDGGLTLPLTPEHIQPIFGAGDNFKDLTELAIGAYTKHHGHAPEIVTTPPKPFSRGYGSTPRPAILAGRVRIGSGYFTVGHG